MLLALQIIEINLKPVLILMLFSMNVDVTQFSRSQTWGFSSIVLWLYNFIEQTFLSKATYNTVHVRHIFLSKGGPENFENHWPDSTPVWQTQRRFNTVFRDQTLGTSSWVKTSQKFWFYICSAKYIINHILFCIFLTM